MEPLPYVSEVEEFTTTSKHYVVPLLAKWLIILGHSYHCFATYIHMCMYEGYPLQPLKLEGCLW